VFFKPSVQDRFRRDSAGDSLRARIAAATVALGGAGGGIAYATGLLTLSGSDVVTHVAAQVTVTGDGTQTVELGSLPKGTTAVDIRLTCLTAGTFTTPDGASMSCGSTDVGTQSDTISWTLPGHPGAAQHHDHRG
jgi:hypothetical protein